MFVVFEQSLETYNWVEERERPVDKKKKANIH